MCRQRLPFLRQLYFVAKTKTMQPSIKMFFKSKQPDPKAVDNPDSPIKKAVEKSVETPSKRVKRAGDEEGDRVDSKRQALASPLSTPVKSKVPEDNKPEPLKTSSTISTPCKQEADQKDTKTTVASPLIDIKVVIRKKIADGAYALHENIGVSWFKALQGEFDKPYFKKLSSFVQQQRKMNTVFPRDYHVYSWTHYHDIRDTRVIILGQDPYHGPGQAHGLSFSVQIGVRRPPSLINIFKELENDIEGFCNQGRDGELTGWAKQGVLMLNTCLTVNQGQANSHQNKGWETFTDAVISWLSKNASKKLVFLLWGRPAQRKSALIDKRHKILTAAHPSPLSAHNGFFGCAHFSQTNSFLKSQGLPEINWSALETYQF